MESLDVAKTRDGVHGPTQMTQHQECLTRRADETTSAAIVLPQFRHSQQSALPAQTSLRGVTPPSWALCDVAARNVRVDSSGVLRSPRSIMSIATPSTGTIGTNEVAVKVSATRRCYSGPKGTRHRVGFPATRYPAASATVVISESCLWADSPQMPY